MVGELRDFKHVKDGPQFTCEYGEIFSCMCVHSNCFVLPLYDYCMLTYSAVEEIWNVIVHCYSRAIKNRLGQVRMETVV